MKTEKDFKHISALGILYGMCRLFNFRFVMYSEILEAGWVNERDEMSENDCKAYKKWSEHKIK